MKMKEAGVCLCVCVCVCGGGGQQRKNQKQSLEIFRSNANPEGEGGEVGRYLNNNPYVTVVGTTNGPMAPQITSISASMYRAPHTTRCGKLKDTK